MWEPKSFGSTTTTIYFFIEYLLITICFLLHQYGTLLYLVKLTLLFSIGFSILIIVIGFWIWILCCKKISLNYFCVTIQFCEMFIFLLLQRYPSGIDLGQKTKTTLKGRHQSRKDLEQQTVKPKETRQSGKELAKNRSTHPQGKLPKKELAPRQLPGKCMNPKEELLSRTDSAIGASHLDRKPLAGLTRCRGGGVKETETSDPQLVHVQGLPDNHKLTKSKDMFSPSKKPIQTPSRKASTEEDDSHHPANHLSQRRPFYKNEDEHKRLTFNITKHQNKKVPLIKKSFNCKKSGFVLTLHTHKMSA